jgi:D-amino-acid dehydrogenase
MRIAEQLRGRGIAVERLDAAATIALEPMLQHSQRPLAGSIRFSGDESGDAYVFCRELAAWLAARGVTFLHGIEIASAEMRDGKLLALVSQGQRIAADAFVMAAGPGSPRLLQTCGIANPIYPVKGYSLTCDISGMTAPGRPIVDMHGKIALTPLGRRLRIAGTAEFGGYDLALNHRRIDAILAHACAIMPALRDLPPHHFSRWTGLRPMTPTGFPMLGRTPLANLFANSGHGPLGWTFAAGSGKIVADLMTTGTHDLAAHDDVRDRIC